jgi:hypothetical protein
VNQARRMQRVGPGIGLVSESKDLVNARARSRRAGRRPHAAVAVLDYCMTHK